MLFATQNAHCIMFAHCICILWIRTRCVKRLPCLANEWLLCCRSSSTATAAAASDFCSNCGQMCHPPFYHPCSLLLPLLLPSLSLRRAEHALGCQLHSESRGANAHLGLSPFPNASTHSSLYIALSFFRSLSIAYIVYGMDRMSALHT